MSSREKPVAGEKRLSLEKDKEEKKRRRIEAWKAAKAKLAEIQELEETASTDSSKKQGNNHVGDKKSDSTNSQDDDDDVDPLDAFMVGVNEELQRVKKEDEKKFEKLNPRWKVDPSSKEDSRSDEEVEEEEEEDVVEALLPKRLRKKEIPKVLNIQDILYPPFEKDLYHEVAEITNMSEETIAEYRKELEIRVRGKNCPKPIKRFHQCGMTGKVAEVMKKYNYEIPTAIQAQALPAAMKGRDVIGIAKTGSGKTLAYLLPMLRQIINQQPFPEGLGDGPIGLILAPTRELAMQIHGEVKKFSKACGLRSACCYGGQNISEQIAILKRGAEIVVATPGRMIDLLCANKGKVTNLLRVTMLVLDEADRMFDMGFEPQIMTIINNIRKDRQTLLFSATFPIKVEQVAKQILTAPIHITVGGRAVVCSDIEQRVEIQPESKKYERLLELIEEFREKGNILIFVDHQSSCDYLFTRLLKAGYPVVSLHGGKDQQDRDYSIYEFKKKTKTIMVATSVAARGLDVEGLNLVVNYDVPNHLEDYVHRVGRTGRAGKKGTAYTFIQENEEQFAPDIVKALQQSKAEIPEEIDKMAQEYLKKKNSGKQVEVHSSGFVGKGFKFDENEASKTKDMRKLLLLEYGEAEIEEEEIEEIKEKHGLNKPDPASKKILSTPTTTSTTTPTGADQSAVQKALEVASRIIKRNTDSSVEEVEINEYPQDARWKVVNGDYVKQVYELTGVNIIVKGVYVAPGKYPPPGERKLYLELSSQDRKSMLDVKTEILRTLREATINSAARGYLGNIV